ncbi:MAG: ribosomal protein L16, partial [Opitutales bacterium]
KPGTMLFEVAGVPITVAREAMRLADTKLQLRCRFVAREELEKY